MKFANFKKIKAKEFKKMNYEKNLQTKTVSLKDGTNATVTNGDTFIVRGEVGFSHFLTPLSKQQIANKNNRRSIWAKTKAGPYYMDDVNKPYGELIVYDASIKSSGALTDAERTAMDKFYESSVCPGLPALRLKSYNAPVSTGKMINNLIIECSFDDELAPGTEVICEGRFFINRNGSLAIALKSVTTLGNPVYIDRTRYVRKSKKTAKKKGVIPA